MPADQEPTALERQRSAYDSYVEWIAQLAHLLDAIRAQPLDELLLANTKMKLAGAYVGPKGVEPADPVGLARQRRLLEAAIAFRDSFTIPAPGQADLP